MDYFIRDIESYKRAINPIKGYREQMIFYVSKIRNLSKEDATILIDNHLSSGKLPIKDKELICYTRAENGDKNLEVTTLLTYIKDIIRRKYITVPTLTNYLPVSTSRSPISKYISENVKSRSILKKEAFEAKAKGDIVKYLFKNNGQNNKKLLSNSITGAFATMGSVFNNPTAHSAVTSITRIETSLANALNEKILAGNRHYRSLRVTLNNLNYLAYITNHELISTTAAKYNLKVPTAEEVLEDITVSTNLYWRDIDSTNKIYGYLKTLNDNELMSVLYTNDMYHIRKHNPEFIRDMLHKVTKVVYLEHEDPMKAFSDMPETIINMTHQLCMDIVRGIGKDYNLLNHEQLCTLLGTATNILTSLEYYKDFIKTFLVTDDMPSSVSYIKDMYRKAVLVSDTDSTMFSVDEWVTWYNGGVFKFSEVGYSISAFLGLITSQVIRHVLAMYSANLGVETSATFNIVMKSEYMFPIFLQTSGAKHYCASIAIKEGNVYNKPEYDIKGAHLQDTLLKGDDSVRTNIDRLFTSISNNEKINILNEISELIKLEVKLGEMLKDGNTDYYKKVSVKDESAYKLAGPDSPYRHYIFWQQVMLEKYGEIDPPIYRGAVLPLTINNKTDIAKWLSSIEDEAFSNRLSNYLNTTKSGMIRTIILPMSYVSIHGIPIEIRDVLDYIRIILNVTRPRRMVLESLGVLMKTDTLASHMFRNLK